ncbi:polysaccharide pyruvyl transferase family protein [Marinomonas sp. BSi20584]|uniref:polysaccharide pyruvyl transferase family protein n=1 Tax=Marinomonas sp. BSi20584 TaxID=1594462 RepID=UPI0012FD17BA|nr:polysaccharide pyruvyl transferase family protein [Marinomonas sp. BSi20584]
MLNNFRFTYKKATYKYSSSDFKINDDQISLFWWREKENLGDALNLDLVEKISCKKVIWSDHNSRSEYNMVVGSVLQLANSNAKIWGAGLISHNARPLFAPKKVFAVRGPMTRDLLRKYNIDCPEIYGDPALLLPKFYSASYSKKYKIGIVPHFIDKNSRNLLNDIPDWVNIIDIETSDVQLFINQICECEFILSSSLHGIIIADAFGIPSARVSFTNKIIGGDFKFQDYSLTVDRKHFKAVDLSNAVLGPELLNLNYQLGCVNTDDLFDSCPFRT